MQGNGLIEYLGFSCLKIFSRFLMKLKSFDFVFFKNWILASDFRLMFDVNMQFSRYILLDQAAALSSGDKGIRTLDPLLARQVLSQLSYTPKDPAATCSPMSSPT